MEIWLQQQASAVLTALAHAQELYGAPGRPPRPFAPRLEQKAGIPGGQR